MAREELEFRGAFIDGEYREGVDTFTVEDPSTGEPTAEVADAGAEGVEDALDAAVRAQEEWSAMDPSERGKILRRVAHKIESHVDTLAEISTREMGRPLGVSQALASSTVGYVDYYAGMTDKIQGDTIPVPGDRHAYTRKEPLGVSAQLVPWNAPLLLCFRGVAPALAAGNAVVAKPSSEAPLALLELAEVATEGGLPDGLFNMVPGSGSTVGAALTGNARVDEITFTGSTGTGKMVGKAAVENVIPMALELGGKSPAVVFEDADIEDAVDGAYQAMTTMSGQVCFATTRVFVHEDVYDEFKTRFVERVEDISMGPAIENPDMGPVISAEALRSIQGYVDEAIENGATALTGGTSPDRAGHFYEPTIIEGAADDARITCEEVFGPVINLYEFADEDEAVRRANDTEFGLYATVWTNTMDRAHRVANGIESGSVMINQYLGSVPQTPFGGYKKSGLGREKGMQAIDHYTQLKTINADLS
jgi:aldehyde dehydrogenase (NAD+)